MGSVGNGQWRQWQWQRQRQRQRRESGREHVGRPRAGGTGPGRVAHHVMMGFRVRSVPTCQLRRQPMGLGPTWMILCRSAGASQFELLLCFQASTARPPRPRVSRPIDLSAQLAALQSPEELLARHVGKILPALRAPAQRLPQCHHQLRQGTTASTTTGPWGHDDHPSINWPPSHLNVSPIIGSLLIGFLS